MVDELESLILTTPPDATAVGELYDAYYDYDLSLLPAAAVLPTSGRGRDVSEVFLTMAKRIGEFRGKTMRDFRAWLYVIAANQVNQLIRQKFRDRKAARHSGRTIAPERTRRPRRRWAALYRALLTLDEEQQHSSACGSSRDFRTTRSPRSSGNARARYE